LMACCFPCSLFFVAPCLDHLKIPSFFTLSITSIFSRLHGVLNVGKKNI
jgi:hypothetical protein